MRTDRDIFLLIGQSNMAGRGRMDDVPALHDPRISMFREGRWIEAEEPLHTDKPEIAGIGLGMSFAMELLSAGDSAAVGLIPCAVGGTPLSRWMPGADLYELALSTAEVARTEGRLCGILWHQGEADSHEIDDAISYGRRLRKMILSLRAALSLESIPFVAGELGYFLAQHDRCRDFAIVNRQLGKLEQSLPHYGCVSAEGLVDNGDTLHFDAASLRQLGVRYAIKFGEVRGAQG